MDSDKPQITIYDHNTGETIVRDMTDNELKELADATPISTDPTHS
jgi:hypothetical protein